MKDPADTALEIPTEDLPYEREDIAGLFQAIFDGSPDCVKLMTKEGSLLNINQAGLNLMGMGKEELIGEKVYRLVAEHDQASYYALIQDARQGTVRALEFEVENAEKGMRRWMEARIIPLRGKNGRTKLLVGITRDIHDKKLALLETEQLSKENRWLAQALISAQEQERKEIAQDLHDDVGQQALAIAMNLEFVTSFMASDNTQIRTALERVVKQTEKLARSVRDLSDRIHPISLKHIDLADSLGILLDEWATGQPNMHVNYQHDCSQCTSSPAKTLALYRTLQECLRNVTRHSQATRVELRLRLEPQRDVNTNALREIKQSQVFNAETKDTDRRGWLSLSIKDNGCGFDPNTVDYGRGLLGMRERMIALGGHLAIENIENGDDNAGSQHSHNKRRGGSMKFQWKSGVRIVATLPVQLNRE